MEDKDCTFDGLLFFRSLNVKTVSRDSSVGIVTGYGMDGLGIESAHPNAQRSKPMVCGRSLAGVAGSDPAGDTDVCVVLQVKTKCKKIKIKETSKDEVQTQYKKTQKMSRRGPWGSPNLLYN